MYIYSPVPVTRRYNCVSSAYYYMLIIFYDYCLEKRTTDTM